MMILLEREALLTGCRLAERLLPARTTDSTRAHALLRAEDAGVQLHAAGPEAALRLELAAEVQGPGDGQPPPRRRRDPCRAARLRHAPLPTPAASRLAGVAGQGVRGAGGARRRRAGREPRVLPGGAGGGARVVRPRGIPGLAEGVTR